MGRNKRYVYEDIGSNDMMYISSAVRYCDININSLSWMLSGKVRAYLFNHLMNQDTEVFRGYGIHDNKLKTIINDIVYVIRCSKLSTSTSFAFEKYFIACKNAFAAICRNEKQDYTPYEKLMKICDNLKKICYLARNCDLKSMLKLVDETLSLIVVVFDVNTDIVEEAAYKIGSYLEVGELPKPISWR